MTIDWGVARTRRPVKVTTELEERSSWASYSFDRKHKNNLARFHNLVKGDVNAGIAELERWLKCSPPNENAVRLFKALVNVRMSVAILDMFLCARATRSCWVEEVENTFNHGERLKNDVFKIVRCESE